MEYLFTKMKFLPITPRSFHQSCDSVPTSTTAPCNRWNRKDSHLLCYYQTKVAFRGFVIRRLFQRKKIKKSPISFRFLGQRHQKCDGTVRAREITGALAKALRASVFLWKKSVQTRLGDVPKTLWSISECGTQYSYGRSQMSSSRGKSFLLLLFQPSRHRLGIQS